jgi:hypothetical protein
MSCMTRSRGLQLDRSTPAGEVTHGCLPKLKFGPLSPLLDKISRIREHAHPFSSHHMSTGKEYQSADADMGKDVR